MRFSDVDLAGPATVVAIDACPPVTLAHDFETGEWVERPVVERHDSQYLGALVHLTTDAGEVTATAYHPFWVVEGFDLANRPRPGKLAEDEDETGTLPGRWVNSHDLLVGDVLVTAQGNRVVLREIRQTLATTPTPVVNLTIAHTPNFTVGPGSSVGA